MGFIRVKGFGFLPVSRLTYKGERDADGSVLTGYTRNANKLEGEPGGGPTTYTGTLSSIDANALKATYDVQGRGQGACTPAALLLASGPKPITGSWSSRIVTWKAARTRLY